MRTKKCVATEPVFTNLPSWIQVEKSEAPNAMFCVYTDNSEFFNEW